MKLKSLAAVPLTVIAGVFLSGGIVATAAEEGEVTDPLVSKGKVVIEEGTVEPSNPDSKIPDPEIPGKEIPKGTPGITTNTDSGNLIIEYVSNLDFGKIKTGSSEQTAFAKPITWTAEETTKNRGAMVVFSDIRANEQYGYTVQAKLTKQFTHTEAPAKVLSNSSIKFSNSSLNSTKGNDNVKPSSVQGGFELELDQAKTVVTADKAGKEGKGQYAVEFGRSIDFTKNAETATETKSVQLVIPSKTASAMSTGTYEAEVTWSIVAAE